MNALKVAIRTHGGAAIGLGHIRRCLHLAHTLTGKGAQVSFILDGESRSSELVTGGGFGVDRIDAERDIEQSVAAVKRRRASVLVTDSYDLEPDYWQRLREHVRLVIAIDDLADKFLPVDVVVNGCANAPALAYSVLPSTRLLLGPNYIMLGNEFAEAPKREFRRRVGRILVTVGGSDPYNLTTKLIRQSLRLEGVGLDVAIGPFFDNQAAIERVAIQSVDRVAVHRHPKDMRSLMMNVDLAITGGGQTAYELAATATPAMAICLAENQRGNLAGLEREGTLVNVGDALALDLPKKIACVLTELDSDGCRRKQLGMRGRQVVDGLGAERVAVAIIEEHEGRNTREL